MGSDTILNSASKTNVFFYNSNDTTVDFCLSCRRRKLSELRIRSGIRQVECTAYYVKKSTAALINLSVNIAKQDVGILSLASLQRVWLARLVLGTNNGTYLNIQNMYG